MWNAPEPDPDGVPKPGVNWCVGAGAPCYGCTEPSFPDRMTPFYKVDGARKRDKQAVGAGY